MQLHQYFDFHVSRQANADCLIFEGAHLSYSDISAQSEQIARGLLDQNIGADDRVAILSENCPEFLSIMLACSRIGAVAVPLNYRLAPSEIAYTLTDSQAKILLSPDAACNSLLGGLSDALATFTTVITCAPDAKTPWNAWLSQHAARKIDVDTYGRQALLQLYTSGTTGHPKGVVLSHQNLNSLFTKSLVAFKRIGGTASRDLVSAPPFHIGGAGTLLLPVMAGGCVVLHRNFIPQAVVDDIERYKIDGLFMVPAMILAITQMVPDLDKRDFSALRQIAYGASPISTALLEKALHIFKCDFYQVYGMTETTGSIASLSAEDHRAALNGRPELLAAAGRPQAGVEAKVIDSDGNTLPPGEIGELLLRSESNMMGYYNRPEATAETVVNGWVHTGDSAIIDEEGYIYLRDRIKDMIVSGAENIYPIEVENAISEHPSVADIAVIGIPDEKYGEVPLGCVVLKPNQTLSVDEMVDWCRERLAGYKIPRQIQIMDALPRNPSGKILKKDLRAPHWKGRDRQIN